jgi:hypothetical protein
MKLVEDNLDKVELFNILNLSLVIKLEKSKFQTRFRTYHTILC